MAMIDDAILEVVRGAGTADEKAKIIRELITAAPTDRWTIRWVIWGLIGLVIIIAIGSIVLVGIKITPIPDGIIALGTTALGALAAYLVPPSHATTTAAPGLIPAPSRVPVVTVIAPRSGPATGGTAVTVTGSGFTGATAVQFGANSATPTDVSDTQITATSPAGNGEVDVRVVTPAGTSAISPAAKFTYS
jgi:hypothetical protein